MKASFGKLSFEIEKGSYFQGEILKGTIKIIAYEELKPIELMLKFKGKESSSNHKLIIVSHQFSILTFNGDILIKGEYSFPFTIRIPKMFPASINDKSFRSKIQYKIKVDLQLLGAEDKNSRVFHSSKVIHIKQAMRLEEKPLKKVWSSDVRICCFHAGTTLLNVRLEKNYFKEGDKVHIRCCIDNSKCKIRFKGIFFKLIRRIEKKDQNGGVKTIDKTMSINIHELTVEARCKDRFFSEIEFIITNDGIAGSLHTSTAGNLFKSSYILKMVGYHDYYLFANNLPDENFPIILYEEDKNYQEKFLNSTNKNEMEGNLMGTMHLNWEQAKLYMGRNKDKFIYPEFSKIGFEMSSMKPMSSFGVMDTN